MGNEAILLIEQYGESRFPNPGFGDGFRQIFQRHGNGNHTQNLGFFCLYWLGQDESRLTRGLPEKNLLSKWFAAEDLFEVVSIPINCLGFPITSSNILTIWQDGKRQIDPFIGICHGFQYRILLLTLHALDGRRVGVLLQNP